MKKMLLFISMIFIVSSSILALGPNSVNLGTAGNYVILTKSGISTTGTTAITGNIAVSPIQATAITGFDPVAMHSSGTYSTSDIVTGKIYAADYTTPTPAHLTAAIGDMEIAYADASARDDTDFTELYAGNITGKTLVPGLYKWASEVLIGAGGVTISGSANDVWIFQIAQNLTVASVAIVTLSGGAQPGNIFWQVAGEANIGTTAQFKGVILCATGIHLNTGATLDGRLFAQTAVTLDANVVTECIVPILALDPPIITSIAKTEQGIKIFWDHVTNANSYNVFDSDLPNTGYDSSVTVGTTNYLFTGTDRIKFFKVKAAN